ncbi:MAG: cytochrome c maturation protein CcmE [Robiginitomaculum sp.]|nr:cytochrome c maturation protein CcmE [Robiginitomaculum sp.]MDQ7076610.1 cytochrome c maturation protein CcmE [Robiginitomaculum sp.]
MIPKKQNTRLLAIGVGGIALIGAVFLVASALKQSISYFYTPTELAQTPPSSHKKLSLGGMVEKGTVKRGEGLNVQFKVTDFNNTVLVQYDKVLPDLFREGQGVVAEGTFGENGVFHATRVLAKHDEKYMPPQVARALKPETKASEGS